MEKALMKLFSARRARKTETKKQAGSRTKSAATALLAALPAISKKWTVEQ
jgi:hypothetical protein